MVGFRAFGILRDRRLFLMGVGLAFLALNGLCALFLTVPPTLLGFFYLLVLEFAIVGHACDLVDGLGSLLLREKTPPRLPMLDSSPPVALVRCVCDDVDLDAWSRSEAQDYPNLHSFILDDSETPQARSQVDAAGFEVVRRANRSGFKAGNLNHFLRQHGVEFRYLLVADSDSVLRRDLVTTLVSYLEHPANRDIAILDSLLMPWNLESEFVRLQAVTFPLIRRSKLRVESRIGSALSVGHNNLCRVKAIQEIGGFDERYSAEDHATSIGLLRTGRWRCSTAPVVSHERLPSNLAEYARRRARYAYQTFQLMSLSAAPLSWPVYLKMLREAHGYLGQLVAAIGILVLVAAALLAPDTAWSIGSGGPGVDSISMELVYVWLPFFVLPGALALTFVLLDDIPLGRYVKQMLFGAALFATTMWPVIRRLFSFWARGRAGFDVTGRVHCTSLLEVLAVSGPGILFYVLACAVVVFGSGSSPLNWLWLLPGLAAPILIVHYQKASRDC